MAVLAGHNHRTTRATDGVGTEAFFKQHPFLCQPVDVRRRVNRFQPAVVRAARVGRVVIAKDK